MAGNMGLLTPFVFGNSGFTSGPHGYGPPASIPYGNPSLHPVGCRPSSPTSASGILHSGHHPSGGSAASLNLSHLMQQQAAQAALMGYAMNPMTAIAAAQMAGGPGGPQLPNGLHSPHSGPITSTSGRITVSPPDPPLFPFHVLTSAALSLHSLSSSLLLLIKH